MDRLKRLLAVFALTVGVAAVGVSAASASPTPEPSPSATVEGEQAKKPPKPKTAAEIQKIAPQLAPGATQSLAPLKRPSGVAAAADSSVTLAAPYNYCYYNEVLLPVTNTSAGVKYVRVDVYNGSTTYSQYLSVSANSTSYAYFYGITGTYYAYSYVWNGSSYAYDDYRTSSLNCSVTRTAACDSYYTGWVKETIQNTGTAYATVQSTKLSPLPTATYYDYPVAGGSAIVRWYYIGTTADWALSADVLYSTLNAANFAGNC